MISPNTKRAWWKSSEYGEKRIRFSKRVYLSIRDFRVMDQNRSGGVIPYFRMIEFYSINHSRNFGCQNLSQHSVNSDLNSDASVKIKRTVTVCLAVKF